MRKIFCFLCCLVCGAQEIKPREATFGDYLSLLNEVGYNTYSYDISSLREVAGDSELSPNMTSDLLNTLHIIL